MTEKHYDMTRTETVRVDQVRVADLLRWGGQTWVKVFDVRPAAQSYDGRKVSKTQLLIVGIDSRGETFSHAGFRDSTVQRYIEME